MVKYPRNDSSRRHSPQENRNAAYNHHSTTSRTPRSPRPRSPRPRSPPRGTQRRHRSTQQRCNFTRAWPNPIECQNRHMLYKISRIATDQKRILDKIVQEISSMRRSAEPHVYTPDPFQAFNRPQEMPSLEDGNTSVASTGSITTQCPSSPMSALQGYNSDQEPEQDFGLSALKCEYGRIRHVYPNVD